MLLFIFRYSDTKLHVFVTFAPLYIGDDISSWYSMSSPSQCSSEYAEWERSRRVANESARREEEFPEQKAQRLEEQAHRTAQARSQESPEQTATRLQHDRQHKRKARAQETPEQTTTSFHCERLHRREGRAQEMPEQRATRLQCERQPRRDGETPQQQANWVQQEQRAQERARQLEHRRAIVQACFKPALKCNMVSLILFTDIHSYYNVSMCNHCCSYCSLLGFNTENRGIENHRHHGILCCNHGKIMLEDLPQLPPTLQHLFSSQSNAFARHFWKKIRQFNAGMAMSSFQANDRTVTRVIQGLLKLLVRFTGNW